MNNEQFLSELSKAIDVDGRVSVDRYCRVLELVETYISSNYSKPIVSGSLPSGREIVKAYQDYDKSCYYGHCAGDSPSKHFRTGVEWLLRRVVGNDR